MTDRGQGFLRRFSLSARSVKFLLNVWPPYRGAGIYVEYLSADFREARVRLALRWFNRNYFGTHFGGSLYAMIDPFYAIMVMQNLGKDYIVWDKRAAIDYRAPARGMVAATFNISQEDIDRIKAVADTGDKIEPTFSVDIVDKSGRVVASVQKTIYVRLNAKVSKETHS
jgi:acyl-coenzyme A thioesterase PaaI-like protein